MHLHTVYHVLTDYWRIFWTTGISFFKLIISKLIKKMCYYDSKAACEVVTIKQMQLSIKNSICIQNLVK